ncbi:hypothetical protein TrLO_g9798 [Triparma laevis f. longispina]|uniref:Uncharacterized protein n=1 Tax=Triparma laevis f. longispina TaxID=1714387 RepID=A0A9W7FHP0_9STRA|nr:hypothetical protein TrLO_g9798 [Triparma laevis f. longispina]
MPSSPDSSSEASVNNLNPNYFSSSPPDHSVYEEDDEEFTQQSLSIFEQCDNELFDQALMRLGSTALTPAKKRQEAFSKKFGMTALHVSLYNRCPASLVDALVSTANGDPRNRNILAVRDDDYGNFPLHVAAQTGCSNDVLRMLVLKYPEALLCENKAKRTPLVLVKRYFKGEFPAISLLTNFTRSYTLYRTRLEVNLLVHRTFVTEGKEVKAGGVKSRKKCERALHMLGFFLVREQYGMLFHILSFVGGKWKSKKKAKVKVKRKSNEINE